MCPFPILAFGLTPSCDLTGCVVGYDVALRRKADLRNALIKLGRATERTESDVRD